MEEEKNISNFLTTNASSIYNTSSNTGPWNISHPNKTACNLTHLYGVDRESLSYTVIAFYILTFICGSVGNSFVIYIIGHFRKIRIKSVANYYIWNLAFADLIFVLSLPFFCWSTYTHGWPFRGILGNVSCKMAYVVRQTTQFTSVFTVVVLSIDRLIATYHNLGYLRSLPSGKLMCLLIWIISGLLSSHYGVFASAIETPDKRVICKVQWPNSAVGSHLYLISWTIVQMTFGLILPSVIIYSSYGSLHHRLKNINARREQSRFTRSSRKMAQTILAVAVTFTLCHVPYYVMQIIHAIQSVRLTGISQKADCHLPNKDIVLLTVYLNALAQIMIFIASCANPFIYGLCNDNFRK